MNKINNPKVAVLLAAYNGQKYIEEQLLSIKAQKSVLVTVFVSLDLSTDSTYQILEKYSKKMSLVILPYGEKYGSSGSNFIRLVQEADFSEFDYIAFSDQDDIWHEEKLFRAINYIYEKKYDGYSSNVEAFWDSGKKELIKKSQPQKKYDHLFESCGPGCTFVMSYRLASTIKNKLLENPSLSREIWMHDWFVYSFVRHKRFRWVIDSWPSMQYRQHANNVVGANSGLGSLLTRVRIMLSGDGFKKVIHQARFIGQENEVPIKLLLTGTRLSFLKLSLMCFQCRRRYIDQFYFFIICIIFSIKGSSSK